MIFCGVSFGRFSLRGKEGRRVGTMRNVLASGRMIVWGFGVDGGWGGIFWIRLSGAIGAVIRFCYNGLVILMHLLQLIPYSSLTS